MNGFDETFDFVVVGSGAGSMCAALVMREAGRSVLILEKMSQVGGTTARSGGVMWIPNNPFMAQEGVEESYEKAVTYMDAVIGDDPAAPGASRERRLAYVREGPQMVEFLVSQGIRLRRHYDWPDYYDEMPGGSVPGRTVVSELFETSALGPWRSKLAKSGIPIAADYSELFHLPHFMQSWTSFRVAAKVGLRLAYAKLSGKEWASSGRALQGQMLHAALKAGVDIRLESPVSQLILEDGAVKGVVATVDGRPRRIGARLGVLINAGGFAHNQQMRDRYQPGSRVEWSQTFPGDTGEMIQEMMRHGAAIAQMEEMVGNQVSYPPGQKYGDILPFIQSTTAAPHAILVDQSGVRYMNEGGSYMAYCKAIFERNKTVPAVPSWAVLDSQFMRKYMLGGQSKATLRRWEQQGFLKRADTVEELAREIKVDPATLKAAVDRFNGFVAKNKDEDFGRGDRAYDRWLGDPYHKPSPTLGTIDKAPFYAAPILPGDVGTYGGVVTDVHARVLREDGSVIAGLYATATSTASVMGRVYPGAGSSVGPGFVWGYVAARHAANLDNVASVDAARAKAGARTKTARARSGAAG
jgi:3-oxosteroid 1-dehydrogenase